MKTVQSLAALKSHALNNGASVELGGSRFNSERSRVSPGASRSPQPVSAAYAPPPEPDRMQQVVMALVAKQLGDSEAAEAKNCEAIAQQIGTAIAQALERMPQPQVNVPAPRIPEAPRKWVFSIQRDKDGLLSAITATAT